MAGGCVGLDRGRHRRGTHHRVRGAGERRQLPGPLGEYSRSGECRLSDRRSAGRRQLRPRQAPGNRRADRRGVRYRAARLRNGRPARVHHARRCRGFYDDPAQSGGQEQGAGVWCQGKARNGQAQGLDRLFLRLQSDRHARVRMAGCARQSAGSRSHPAAASQESRSRVRGDPHRVSGRHGDARIARPRRHRSACHPGSAAAHRCAGPRQGAGGPVHPRNRAAHSQRAAECDGIRRGAAEAGGDRGLLAGAHRQAHGRARRGARPGVKRRLIELAHARSGDKGDTANVGLIAKKPAFYPILVKQVTAARVARHFKGTITGPVERFELPNLNALNFLLHGALDGGAADGNRRKGTQVTDRVLTTMAGGVLTATLNRPDKRNAIDIAMIDALTAMLSQADLDATVRVVARRGAGRDFCAGVDLNELLASADHTLEQNRQAALHFAGIFVRMRRLPKPVVALVQGRALAGGCGLATACDLVLATESSQFGYPEVQRGFVPAIVMTMLKRTVGEKVAFDLAATGRVLSAPEAAGLGLVSRVYADSDFEEQVAEVLRALAASSASALALTKQQFYQLDGMRFEDGIRLGADVNAVSRTTPDFRAALQAFLKK